LQVENITLIINNPIGYPFFYDDGRMIHFLYPNKSDERERMHEYFLAEEEIVIKF